jgi:hypothetical protein
MSTDRRLLEFLTGYIPWLSSILAVVVGLLSLFFALMFPSLQSSRDNKLAGANNNSESTIVVCIGEFEQNCPRKADLFYYCPPEDDKSIAQLACNGHYVSVARMLTISGNKCGYAILEVHCK